MSNDPKHEIQIDSLDQHSHDAFDEEYETVGDYHRKAAQYFVQAAKHHLAAAEADDDGDDAALELHAFKAYRNQLNGVQCAEIAVMESDDGSGALDDQDGLDEASEVLADATA
jgi:hypothetical protein